MKLLYFFKTSIVKTLIFNGVYFGFKSIFHPKVLIAKNVRLLKLKGTVIIAPSSRISHIGFSENIVNKNVKCWTVFYNEGIITFKGHFAISKGCTIRVNKGASMEVGDHFHISMLSKIECRKHIAFGDNVMISWNCLFMDSDTHKILVNGKIANPDDDIIIGNKVWICCNCFITKGSRIPAETTM